MYIACHAFCLPCALSVCLPASLPAASRPACRPACLPNTLAACSTACLPLCTPLCLCDCSIDILILQSLHHTVPVTHHYHAAVCPTPHSSAVQQQRRVSQGPFPTVPPAAAASADAGDASAGGGDAADAGAEVDDDLEQHLQTARQEPSPRRSPRNKSTAPQQQQQ